MIFKVIGLMVRMFANGPEDKVPSYQRLKKWYLITPYLTVCNIRYVSRVKCSNAGKEVGLPLHLGIVGMKRKPSDHTRLQSSTFQMSRIMRPMI